MSRLDDLKLALTAVGAECVEGDESYEWWSLEDGDDFIDVRITRPDGDL